MKCNILSILSYGSIDMKKTILFLILLNISSLFYSQEFNRSGLFYPDYYAVKRQIRDSVELFLVKENLIDSSSIKHGKYHYNVSNHQYKITGFYIPELVRDTFMVSKVQRNYYHKHDNLCGIESFTLRKPLKLSVYDFHFSVPEGTLIFELPNFTSRILHHREETEFHKNMKILEYFIDECGLMWIKVSFNFDYVVEDSSNLLNESYKIDTKHVCGWIKIHELNFWGRIDYIL
ncbi:MAG: hypothetical protein V4622_01275 [Bacteroidota bacterium]